MSTTHKHAVTHPSTRSQQPELVNLKLDPMEMDDAELAQAKAAPDCQYFRHPNS